MLSLRSTIIALSMSSLCLASVVPSMIKRQDPVLPGSCDAGPFGTGIPLVVRPVGQGYNGPITYVGVVSGVKHQGIDGQQDSILVTKDANGKPLTGNSLWEYCPNTGGQGSIIRPFNTTQHCIAIESTNDTKTGARNSLLDSYCDKVPTQYKGFTTTESGENYQGGYNIYLDLASNPKMTIVVGNTLHGEIQFYAPGSNPSGQAMHLQLLVPHEN